MDLYRDEILEHYKRPHNFGDLPSADGVYEEYNPLCGDRILLQLVIRDARIAKVRFKGEGCAISTASASIITDYLRGKKVEEVKNLRGEAVLKITGLETISPGRFKCALLVLEALRGALGTIKD